MIALPQVLLVVVNWNGRSYLQGCLASLLQLDYPRFSVTVVDNASTDGSAEFIRQHFPQVQLRCSPENLGFGGGANLALRECQADIAVILNTDILVPPDWLSRLVAPVMADPAIGIAGCKLRYPGGRTIQHAGGYISWPQAWPGHYGLNAEDEGQWDVMRDVDYVIGAALAVKREVLQRIGLFDDGYFLYYEDVDLCARAKQAGYRVVYVPDAWLTHVESAVTVRGSAAYLSSFSTGRWRFILKHYDPENILSETIPAEREWLSRSERPERHAARAAYRAIIATLPEIWRARERDGEGVHVREVSDEESVAIARWLRVLIADSGRPAVQPEVTSMMNDIHAHHQPIMQQLQSKRHLREQPFVSGVPVLGPLIAGLRSAWNSISTKWYVRPLLQQQNEFNELVVNQLTDLGARLHDHDAWLVAQDREQSELVHDLAELRLQLVQMNHSLQDLRRRMDRLAAGAEPHEEGRAA